MSIKPLRNWVLIRQVEVEEVTPGGIIIPDKTKDNKPLRGVVEEVGDGAHENGKRVDVSVKRGQMVVFLPFNKGSVLPISYKGQQFLLMPETSVIAIIK